MSLCLKFSRLAAIGLIASTAAPTSANANATRVTRGDAEAVFQAAFNGGWAIRLNQGEIEGAPEDFMADGLVRISPATMFNNKHYCALDWHVISVATIEGNRPGESMSNQEIWDRLAARQVTFQLDGSPLPVERTMPRRTTNPEQRGFYEAFDVNTGRVMAPEELSAGQHNLIGFGNLAGVIGNITFHIDAPGTGVCGPDAALTFREVN